jgi:hypothetical protein
VLGDVGLRDRLLIWPKSVPKNICTLVLWNPIVSRYTIPRVGAYYGSVNLRGSVLTSGIIWLRLWSLIGFHY